MVKKFRPTRSSSTPTVCAPRCHAGPQAPFNSDEVMIEFARRAADSGHLKTATSRPDDPTQIRRDHPLSFRMGARRCEVTPDSVVGCKKTELSDLEINLFTVNIASWSSTPITTHESCIYRNFAPQPIYCVPAGIRRGLSTRQGGLARKR
jgi:hypothetical protein